jgi:hypothetical protein
MPQDGLPQLLDHLWGQVQSNKSSLLLQLFGQNQQAQSLWFLMLFLEVEALALGEKLPQELRLQAVAVAVAVDGLKSHMLHLIWLTQAIL